MNGENSMEISDVMSYLINNRAPNLPPLALSEVLDYLIWCLSDNGEGINVVRRIWLSSTELYKVEVALAMDEVFPYDNREEMMVSFAEIIERWPHLKDRCHNIVSAWDKLDRP